MEIVLLGAGASVEGGVPASFKMTERIYNEFCDDASLKSLSAALTFVIGGLQFQHGVSGENPFSGVDVEELFNAVDFLSARTASEAAPFVNAWHPMVDWYGRHHDFGSEIESLVRHIKEMCEISLDRSNTTWRQRDVADAFHRLFAPPNAAERRGTFQSITEAMTHHLISITYIRNPSLVGYLVPLLNLFKRQKRLVVATLNYDNSIERVSAAHNIPCDAGIENWNDTGSFHFGGDGLHLLKLHGSLNWRYGSIENTSYPPLISPITVVNAVDWDAWPDNAPYRDTSQVETTKASTMRCHSP